MKVSVPMLTFEHEPYIATAIESVLEQDLGRDVELVIGEDCSRDRTRAIAEGYAARHPGRVRLLPSERRLGAMANWLRVLAECRGEYVAMLDGDDCFLSPHKLSRQVEMLERAPDLELCLHVCREVYEDGSRPPHDATGQRIKPRYGLADLLRGPIANSSTLLCRRRVLDELPDGFVEAPVGDWALQLLSARHGDIGFIDEVMSLHRNHAGGIFAGCDRARQRRMLVETRRLILPLLPPELAATAREAEFHDILQQGRAHERLGEYGEAVRCYEHCLAHRGDAGGTTGWQIRRRMLRARVGGLIGSRRAPRAAAARSPAGPADGAQAAGH
jgi:glycosyltransferase involved in cell wall biosynthesis